LAKHGVRLNQSVTFLFDFNEFLFCFGKNRWKFEPIPQEKCKKSTRQIQKKEKRWEFNFAQVLAFRETHKNKRRIFPVRELVDTFQSAGNPLLISFKTKPKIRKSIIIYNPSISPFFLLFIFLLNN
jgi:hypothetical protein